MKNEKFNIRPFFTALFSMAFAVALIVSGAQTSEAQRRFDPRAAGTENELKNLTQFTQDLLNFIRHAQAVEANPNAGEPERKKLQDLGRRVKDSTSNARSHLQGFISKLKNGNRWNDEFDADFLDSISNLRVKSLIKRVGGARKALTEAEAALNSLGQDVDATVNDAKNASLLNMEDKAVFMNASFAVRRGGKVRVKCVLLGVGVAVAEVARLKLTAENLDNLFDSSKCGTASPAT